MRVGSDAGEKVKIRHIYFKDTKNLEKGLSQQRQYPVSQN